jgi:two-component system, cell cycle response regulator CpdR
LTNFAFAGFRLTVRTLGRRARKFCARSHIGCEQVPRNRVRSNNARPKPGTRRFCDRGPNIKTFRRIFLRRRFPRGQSQPYRQVALVVEDDALQRETIVTLLEESEMDVIQCESGEAAALVLDHVGGCVTALLTDVNLAGAMDGVELAQIARERFPALHIIVLSGNPRASRLPDGAQFIAKPWNPLELPRETHAWH